MKDIHYIFTLFIAGIALAGCGNGNKPAEPANATIEIEETVVRDSALYGVVGRGTAMHSVELVSEDGKSLTASLNVDLDADVQGGIYCDDRITMVLGINGDGEQEVVKAINLTSLCGHWMALDRNFEIIDDGTIISLQGAETNPYTHWSMVNCNLVLNRDTFEVAYLGPDSLALENDNGIFVYKRMKEGL